MLKTQERERTERKALSGPDQNQAIAQSYDAEASGLFYTKPRRTVKDLWAEARAKMQEPERFYFCGRCGAEQNANSQQFFSGGQAVCIECFDRGLQEWLSKCRKNRKRVGG